MKIKRRVKRDARRLFRMCVVDGMLQEARVMQVVTGIRKLSGRDRLPLLHEFRRLVGLEITRRTATIASAVPLPEEVHSSVGADLEQRYGRGLRMSFLDEPGLIGGMRIRVGNDIYDGSVLGRLESLETRF